MNKINLAVSVLAVLFLSSCLKTRSELGENYQSQVYSKKQADNQKANEPAEVVKVDEKDELIRTLNGRVEALENQIGQLNKEKAESEKAGNTDAQKIQVLQDSLIKMETQLTKLESELAAQKAMEPAATGHATTPAANSSDAKVPPVKGDLKSSKNTTFDIAQSYFAKKDFKNAILEYQKFVDANAKTKNKLVPEAKYKIGLCFESMGLKDEATSFYEEVAAQHGNTEFGKKAKAKVAKTKK